MCALLTFSVLWCSSRCLGYGIAHLIASWGRWGTGGIRLVGLDVGWGAHLVWLRMVEWSPFELNVQVGVTF